MLAVLLVTQVAGLLLLYWLLSRRIRRASDVSAHVAALRAEVGGLVAELNGTTDRNVRLLEDRVAGVNVVMAKLDRKLGVLRRDSARLVQPVLAATPPAVVVAAAARNHAHVSDQGSAARDSARRRRSRAGCRRAGRRRR